MGPINSMVAGTRAGPKGECHKSLSVKVRQRESGDRQRAESSRWLCTVYQDHMHCPSLCWQEGAPCANREKYRYRGIICLALPCDRKIVPYLGLKVIKIFLVLIGMPYDENGRLLCHLVVMSQPNFVPDRRSWC